MTDHGPERLLTITLWISLILHLGLLFALPAPGRAESPPAIAVEVEWIAAEAVDSEDSSERSPPEPPPPEPLPPETLPPEPAPPPLEPAQPEPPKPAEPSASTPEAASSPPENTTLEDAIPASAEPETPIPPMSATPSTELLPPPEEPEGEQPEVADSESADPETAEPEVDPAAIERMFEKTKESIDSKNEEWRYRVVEVREKVLRALEEIHPGSEVVATDRARFRCLLSLSVDADGYIFDLGLRTPPGSRLDVDQVRRAIGGISPVAPPPAGMTAPVSFTWKIDFAD